MPQQVHIASPRQLLKLSSPKQILAGIRLFLLTIATPAGEVNVRLAGRRHIDFVAVQSSSSVRG